MGKDSPSHVEVNGIEAVVESGVEGAKLIERKTGFGVQNERFLVEVFCQTAQIGIAEIRLVASCEENLRVSVTAKGLMWHEKHEAKICLRTEISKGYVELE